LIPFEVDHLLPGRAQAGAPPGVPRVVRAETFLVQKVFEHGLVLGRFIERRQHEGFLGIPVKPPPTTALIRVIASYFEADLSRTLQAEVQLEQAPT